MRLKRLAAVTMSMMMAFSMTAFANDADAVAVYQEMEAKSNSMTDMNAFYDFDISANGAGMNIGARLEMNAKANHITTPEQMRMNMYMRITMTEVEMQSAESEVKLSGEDLSDMIITANMYYADNMYYIDMMDQKVKQPMPLEAMMNSIKQTTGMVTNSLDYMQDLKLRTEGENRIISYTMDSSKMNDFLSQVMGMAGMESLTGSDISVSYRDISGEYIVAPDGYCDKAKMKMTLDMTMQGENITIILDGDVGFADPGQPVEIQAPDLSGYTLAETE